MKTSSLRLPLIAIFSIILITCSLNHVVEGRQRSLSSSSSSSSYSNRYNELQDDSPGINGEKHYDDHDHDDEIDHEDHDGVDHYHEQLEGQLSSICLKDDIYEKLPSPIVYDPQKNFDAIHLARNNMKKMLGHRCGTPRPVVLPVQNFYPNVSKDYIPRSVMLHRCEQSGCCSQKETTCKPNSTDLIWEHFYVIYVDVRAKTRPHVEQLAFINHTHCECTAIKNMPREQEQLKPEPHHRHKHHRHHEGGKHRHHHHHKHHHSTTELPPKDRKPVHESSMDSEIQLYGPLTSASAVTSATGTGLESRSLKTDTRQQDDEDATKTDRSHYCRWIECPRPFSVRESTKDMSNPCSCDCFPDERECMLVKRGKKRLDPQEKYCVQRKICLEPQCDTDYEYDRIGGQCIQYHRLAEPISYANYYGHNPSNHRSSTGSRYDTQSHNPIQWSFYNRRRYEELYERD